MKKQKKIIPLAEIYFSTLDFCIWVSSIVLVFYSFFSNNGLIYNRNNSSTEVYCEILLFAMIYVALMCPVQRVITKSIRGLIGDETDFDAKQAQSIATYLCWGTIIGGTLIWTLLLFDYQGHSAAENFEMRQKTIGAEKLFQSSLDEATWLEKTGGMLGTYGDFFGGVLNPLLTFGTLIALAITIFLQREQISKAKAESTANQISARKQAFESTFFNMLNIHSENLKSLSFNPELIETGNPLHFDTSRRAVHLARYNNPDFQKIAVPVSGRAVFEEVLMSTLRGSTTRISQLAIYETLQTQHNDVLGHYFRHLYQILRLVDNFSIAETAEEQVIIGKPYTNILRAQLSSSELNVLILNCTYAMVDDGEFAKLIIKYQMLEHVPIVFDPNYGLRVHGIALNGYKIFSQYFEKDEHGLWTSGAYGANPKIRDFLAAQSQADWAELEM